MKTNNPTVDLTDAQSYRTPLPVTEVRCFRLQFGFAYYPVCPRCHMTMEREYQSFCDRCGQALDWKIFSKATIIYKE